MKSWKPIFKLSGMFTKDIEKENRLKAQSNKSYQELKEAMSNLEKAIDKAQTSINQRIDEAFSKIALEVESFLIEWKNERLQLEANYDVNRIELSLEKEMKSYSGTPTTTDYACTEINNEIISEQIEIEEQINLIGKDMNDYESDSDYDEYDDNITDLDDTESFYIINESENSFSFDAKFSELSMMNERSELENVNDIEVDWAEDIVFNHANIQPLIVKCLPLSSKNSRTSQQELNAMKHVATDVEVISTNALRIGTELNDFAQFGETLPRKIWDPGLDTILL